jgi:hypothetical protein
MSGAVEPRRATYLRVFNFVLLAAVLAGCAGSPPMASAPVAADSAVHEWNRSVVRVPLPGAGCFKASYPAKAWSRIDCAPATRRPVRRRDDVRPATISYPNDYVLSVGPRIISTAIGSFPDVSGVKQVKSVAYPPGSDECAVCGEGTYSLQLNSNFYTLAPCGVNPKCLGWEQLVYASPGEKNGKGGEVFIEDWRIKPGKAPLKCPPDSAGWRSEFGDCFYNSAAVHTTHIPIAQLDKLGLSLSVASTGDSGFFTVGTTVYGMKDMQGDFMQLSRNWTAAEFNVFANCCYGRAIFNPGSTITVMIEAAGAGLAAPDCPANGGTTGESSAMSFVSAPKNPMKSKYPSVLFTESNVSGGGAASCDALSAL